MPGHRRFYGVLLLGFLLTGCVSLPQEVPELSAEIGKRIIESRTSHLTLVHRYLQEKRDRIDEFIAREWIPAFAENVFRKPTIAREWDRIVHNDDKTARLEFITGLGTLLQNKINAKRLELMAPIDEVENLLVAHLNEHYDQMLAANSTLTAFLTSARSVKERQRRVLGVLEIDGKLSAYMGKADEIVGKIVAGKNAYESNKDKINGILDELRQSLGGQ